MTSDLIMIYLDFTVLKELVLRIQIRLLRQKMKAVAKTRNLMRQTYTTCLMMNLSN